MISFHINGGSTARCLECNEPFQGKAVGHTTEEKVNHLFHEQCLPRYCDCDYEFPSPPTSIIQIIVSPLAGIALAELGNYLGIEMESMLLKTITIMMTSSFATMGAAFIIQSNRFASPSNLCLGGFGLFLLAASAAEVFLPTEATAARTISVISFTAGIMGSAILPIEKISKIASYLLNGAINLSGSALAYHGLSRLKNLPITVAGLGAGAAHSLTNIIRKKFSII